ncbi:hypothetical protein EDD86DRAFT_244809 [Gorgonomyces haynaldii]|nr:hypothetical protein EDD86DRAFT_244809 [Gorgonomyces haynaldii]
MRVLKTQFPSSQIITTLTVIQTIPTIVTLTQLPTLPITRQTTFIPQVTSLSSTDSQTASQTTSETVQPSNTTTSAPQVTEPGNNYQSLAIVPAIGAFLLSVVLIAILFVAYRNLQRPNTPNAPLPIEDSPVEADDPPVEENPPSDPSTAPSLRRVDKSVMAYPITRISLDNPEAALVIVKKEPPSPASPTSLIDFSNVGSDLTATNDPFPKPAVTEPLDSIAEVDSIALTVDPIENDESQTPRRVSLESDIVGSDTISHLSFATAQEFTGSEQGSRSFYTAEEFSTESSRNSTRESWRGSMRGSIVSENDDSYYAELMRL